MKKSVQLRQEKAAEGHFGDHDKDKHKQERTKDTVNYFRMPHVENACQSNKMEDAFKDAIVYCRNLVAHGSFKPNGWKKMRMYKQANYGSGVFQELFSGHEKK